MVPGDDQDSPYGGSVTLEEMEAAGATVGEPADLTKVKAEGDEVPEAYRGKSVSEIIALAEVSRQGMRAADESRAAAEARAALAATRPIEQAPAPQAEVPELTREKFAELYAEDPVEALAQMEAQNIRKMMAHVDARLSPLAGGITGQVENWARQEYADEFALFGDQIQKVIDGMPNKQFLTGKKGWEDVVAYVRGQKDNFEKLVDHREAAKSQVARGEARREQVVDAGFSGRSAAGRGAGAAEGVPTGMDEEQLKIADRFVDSGVFKSRSEYMRWYKGGGQ